MTSLLLVAVVLVFVILIAVPLAYLLAVLTTAIAALTAAVFVVLQLALNDVFDLNGQTQGILSILVIGATTDYSLLVVSRYDELQERHADRALTLSQGCVRQSLPGRNGHRWSSCAPPLGSLVHCVAGSDCGDRRRFLDVGCADTPAWFAHDLWQ